MAVAVALAVTVAMAMAMAVAVSRGLKDGVRVGNELQSAARGGFAVAFQSLQGR